MKEQNKNKVNTGFTLNNDIVKLMDELLDDIGNTNRSRYIEKLIREDFEKRGIKIEKRSFMNLEITLYVNNQFDIKSKEIKNILKDLFESIVDDSISDKKLFNFYKSKK